MNRKHQRRILLEKMEKRLPLAADAVHNFLLPGDVDNSQAVTSIDALLIINALSRGDSGAESESVDASIRDLYVDVNDDGKMSPLDALLVINDLGRQSGELAPAELIEGNGDSRARIELELDATRRGEFEVKLVGAPADQTFDVIIGGETLGQIQTNSQGRGKLELKFGGTHPELPDVLANADANTTVEIGNQVSGTLGSLGEIEASDGGSDGASDGHSDTNSDGDGDALSDGNTDGELDGESDASSDGDGDSMSDGESDGGVDGLLDGLSDSDDDSSLGAVAALTGELDNLRAESADAESSVLSDGGVDDDVDEISDGSSDAGSDAASDGDSDAESDGGSD